MWYFIVPQLNQYIVVGDGTGIIQFYFFWAVRNSRSCKARARNMIRISISDTYFSNKSFLTFCRDPICNTTFSIINHNKFSYPYQQKILNEQFFLFDQIKSTCDGCLIMKNLLVFIRSNNIFDLILLFFFF